MDYEKQRLDELEEKTLDLMDEITKQMRDLRRDRDAHMNEIIKFHGIKQQILVCVVSNMVLTAIVLALLLL